MRWNYLFILLFPLISHAEVYKCYGEDGIVLYSGIPCTGNEMTGMNSSGKEKGAQEQEASRDEDELSLEEIREMVESSNE